MQLPVLGLVKEYIPVPKTFHSFASGKPFDRCVVCEKHLLENGTQYVVEKAIKKYPGFGAQDVIYEYAMCIGCTTRMREALSGESLVVIDQYFDARVNLVERRNRMLRTAGLNVEAWLSHCLLTGTPREDLSEYQLYAHCDGPDMLFSYLPYMISAQALSDLSNLISAETKDILDDFIDEHFGLPPELKQLLKTRKSILL
jgi:hypothetical protein